MFVRILTGAILLAIIVALLFLGEMAVGIVAALFTLIGVNEFYKALESSDNERPIKWVSFLFPIPILIYLVNSQYDLFEMSMYMIAVIIFFVCIFKSKKHSFKDAFMTLISGLVVTNMFYCILAAYKAGNDKVESAMFLGIILIGASITDTFAYFIGITMGRHKLCPAVSPKKSIEGSIGGMVFVTLAMAAYGYFVLNRNINGFRDVPLYLYVILGVVCGVISQIGDLSASLVKRHYGIKDFGRLFPGHGGILDRFDSFIFVTPVVYFFIMHVGG